MKKLLLAMFALLMMANVQAQEGEIVYIDFEPDMTLTQGVNFYDSIMLDIDGNSSFDIQFGLCIEEHGFEMPYLIAYNNWQVCVANGSETLNSDNLFWSWLGFGPWNDTYYGLRNVVGGDFYYGWIYVYDGQINNHGTLFIDRMAHCPIPNYPLQAGQTSYYQDVNENTDPTFATVHPNPTNGQVTVTGTELKSVDVFNELGQRVATKTSSGNQLIVDLSGQSAGVYFVNVTDKEGHKCVRKVVKK